MKLESLNKDFILFKAFKPSGFPASLRAEGTGF
jgi:hypothetical protein